MKLALYALLCLRRNRIIAFGQALPAQLLQVFPCALAIRNVKARQLVLAEFDRHMTALCNLLRIFQCLKRVGEELCHLLRAFDIVLAALITKPVFI